ncbi:MAG: HupE/UreJ family protein [Myxococcales bacterium]|nr:HupE/UreJ family protein [Myxococcales bacterium]
MRWLGLGVLLWAATAGAHDFEALRLEVDVGPARVAGVLLVPSAQVEGRAPRVGVPGCEGSQSARLEARMLRVVFDLACAAAPTRLVLDDLPPGAPVLASVRRGGEATVAVLDAAAPTLALGDPGGWLRFVPIGAAHILEGADHLLFVLAFVLLVSRLRRLAGALTGFTLGRSPDAGRRHPGPRAGAAGAGRGADRAVGARPGRRGRAPQGDLDAAPSRRGGGGVRPAAQARLRRRP